MLTLGEEVPSFGLPGIQRGALKDLRCHWRTGGFIALYAGTALVVSMIMSTLGLFALGAAKGYLARLGIWKSGLEVLVIATAAALAGYGFELLLPEH